MDIFNIVAGIASIVSLIISLITLGKVIKITNNMKFDQSIKSNQVLKSKDITNSHINQAGGNIK